MLHTIARAELIDRLVLDLKDGDRGAAEQGGEVLGGFAQTVLRRADERYLYRHRLTTLSAQLRDSFDWVREALPTGEVRVRAFRPTEAEHGYALEGNIIECVLPDQPFIYDTLKLYMERSGFRVLNSLAVVMSALVEDGTLVAIASQDAAARNYGYVRFYVDWAPTVSPRDVVADIDRILEIARAMVADFHRMVRTVKDLSNEFDYLAKIADEHAQDCLEVSDLLNWLVDDNFVFMGISYYDRPDGGITTDAARGLGASRQIERPSGQSTAETYEFLAGLDTLAWPIARIRKSTEDSVVHRAGKIDEILVRTFDDQGHVIGGMVIHGMFTFKGLGEAGSSIPILRRKLARILEREEAVASSYEYKSLVNAFNALPVEYCFEATDDEIHELLQLSVKADATGELQAQVVLSRDTRSAYVFLVIPKEHYSDELRAALQGTVKDMLKATYADHRVYLGKFGTVALHFYMTGDEDFGQVSPAEIERTLLDVGTPWTLRLRQELENARGEKDGGALHERYSHAFPESYREESTARDAVNDILHLEAVSKRAHLRFEVLPSRRSEARALLRIYSREEVLLTDILPVIAHLGVVVAEQSAYEIRPTGTSSLTINTLHVVRGEPDLYVQRWALIDALRAVFAGRMRNDRLNRLLLAARLTWREVDLFRAYYGHARQLGLAVGTEVLEKLLLRHASFVQKLAALFRARFDPDWREEEEARENAINALREQCREYLDAVKSFEEDRLLRTFLNLIEATVRTNFYRERDVTDHLISYKIRCADVAEMPDPRPMFEIFVHHAQVEGVHLRGGKVARGGLRWSDRLDDYRSEVLGLMATQMLKNTLIVPVGAKGGFVLKDPVEDWAEGRARADALYRVFIRGLLEITDNIVDGDIVPSPRVLRYDGDDPYLVVAADKGTAHLSDTANAIAADFDFWLGDAFASGGSIGYDHKEKAITASGAWVCVRRHFQEMGIDPEVDPVTAVGIGDMSGDVFGNGLLLSRSLKLIAAFNHRHIFLDPDPDPEASWIERKRLFDLPRSNWTDYDPTVISAGGGIYDRGAKAIALSPEAADVLGTDAVTVSGEQLIRRILAADVDLLWNGGIGTYVKATTETHADVEDKDNDRVRVDASELRCRVVGEGGNLGVTMRARVEYCQRGGRLNLDAIDNSGGVDLSDHEVNLKVLLRPLVASGALKLADRNRLLVAAGDEVCRMVLANSGSQSLAISLDETRSKRNVWRFSEAIDFLKAQVGFSRRAQRLPRGREVFRNRVASQNGLFRPELAKLLSYTKMMVKQTLGEGAIGTREELLPFVRGYFPASAVEAHADAVDAHLLYHEITATVLTNRVVDRAGVTFFPSLVSSTDRTLPEILTAYLIVDDVLGLGALRAELLELEGALPTSVGYPALIAIEDTIAAGVELLLAPRRGPAMLGVRAEYEPVRGLTTALTEGLDRMLPLPSSREIQTRTTSLETQGLPPRIARRIAALGVLPHAFAIAELAATHGLEPSVVATLYFGVGQGVLILPFVERISQQAYSDPWDSQAVRRARRSLHQSLLRITASAAASGGDSDGVGLQHASRRLARLADVRADIEKLLVERIPTSATFVISERLRHRVRELSSD